MSSLRITLLLIGTLSGAGALAAWVILGLGGDPWDAGLPVVIVGSILTAIGAASFLLDRHLSKRR